MGFLLEHVWYYVGFGYTPFLRTTSPVSGFRVTDTTFIRRRLPPCRIRETTCRWPTFTTLTPFTCHKEVLLYCLQNYSGSVYRYIAQRVTSIRKSPVRSPALHATPSRSTDSRYCSAGNAGVGVNSSIGVSAGSREHTHKKQLKYNRHLCILKCVCCESRIHLYSHYL